MPSAYDRWILTPPEEDDDEEYCEDGSCGACPGCRFQEGDEKFHAKRDRELEEMTEEEFEKGGKE